MDDYCPYLTGNDLKDHLEQSSMNGGALDVEHKIWG